jgi:hypothetical protein
MITRRRGARGVADAAFGVASRSRAVRMRGKLAHRVDAREGGAGRRAYGAMRARVDARGWGFGIAAPIARERSGRRRALAHGRIAHRSSAMDVDDMHACVRAVCDGFACARGAAASFVGVGSYRGCGVDKVARGGFATRTASRMRRCGCLSDGETCDGACCPRCSRERRPRVVMGVCMRARVLVGSAFETNQKRALCPDSSRWAPP